MSCVLQVGSLSANGECCVDRLRMFQLRQANGYAGFEIAWICSRTLDTV